jgi:hypothetical protein
MSKLESVQSGSVGNAGEYLVAAHLLMRGFHGGFADRGNRAFDLITRKGDAFAGIRVKTSTHRATRFTWTCKKTGEVFLEIGKRDFVVMTYLPNKQIAHARFWIVPTPLVDQTLREVHVQWLASNRRDGAPHKDTALRGFTMTGDPASYRAGFEQKWLKYENAWDQLA